DGDNTNDAGGQAGSAADDAVDGDGTGTAGDGVASTDEDDHDSEGVTVIQQGVADLALSKYLGPEEDEIAELFEDVTFIIEVINEGDVTVQDLEVIDYIPLGFKLSPLDDNGWIATGDNYVNTIADPLVSGASETVEIILRITSEAYILGLTTVTNIAEIQGAYTSQGVFIDDIDSTPDGNADNDPPGEDDTDLQQVILDDPDPIGWIYCEETGELIEGGTIQVTGPGNAYFATLPDGTFRDGHDGSYQFFVDQPGTYTMVYTHPDGYTMSTTCPAIPGIFDPTGRDGDTTPDANGVYDRDGIVNNLVTLGSDAIMGYLEDNTCMNNPYFLAFDLDANNPLVFHNNLPVTCGCIGGVASEDIDGDEDCDMNDPAMYWLSVYLYDCNDLSTPIDTTYTDANGQFEFGGLPTGDYRVQYEIPIGYRPVVGSAIDLDGYSECLSLTTSDCSDMIHLCLTQCEVVDAGSDVTICNGGSVNLQATGGGTGANYFWMPAEGLSCTNCANPTATPTAKTTYTVTSDDGNSCISYDQVTVTVLPCDGVISGNTFIDCSNPGIHDLGDGALAGVTVTLSGTDFQSNQVYLTTLTDINGHYNFPDVAEGNYTVNFEMPGLPGGLAFSPKDVGSNDSQDSDVNPLNGTTDPFVFAGGETLMNLDAGYMDVEAPQIHFTDPLIAALNHQDTLIVPCDTIPIFEAGIAYATDNLDLYPGLVFEDIYYSVDICDDGYRCQYEYVWTAFDECGNTTVFSFYVKPVDTVPPVLYFVPEDITIECAGTPEGPPTVFAIDNCDCCTGPMEVEYTETTTGSGCNVTILRSWTSTDNCGNTTTETQTITISDDTGPVITLINPALAGLNHLDTLVVECDDVPAYSEADAVVSDNCDVDPVLNFLEDIIESDNCIQDGYRIFMEYTFWAADDCGNITEFTFFLKVVDTTPPVITGIPDDLVMGCIDIPAAPALTAIDNCDEAVAVTFSETQSGDDCHVTILRSWTATDDCGNTIVETQTISAIDDESPVITITEPTLAGISHGETLTVECDDVPIYDVSAATASDNCNPNPLLTFSKKIIESDDCEEDGYLFLMECTFLAVDDCGNKAEFTFFLKVVDTTPPVFVEIEEQLEMDCACCDQLPLVEPVAIDNCDGDVELSYTDGPLEGACGCNIVRTWTATDDCGNVTTATQTVTIVDEFPPLLQNIPDDITIECGEELPVVPAVTVLDNCDDEIEVVYTQIISGEGCYGLILRTWTAADKYGNVTVESQVITMRDNTAPVFTSMPDNMTVECGTVPPLSQPVVTDNCDNNVSISFSEEQTGTSCNGYLVRTWTATDDCGNTSVRTQTIITVDNTPPTLVGVPEGLTIDCGLIPAPAQVIAYDNCDQDVGIAFNESQAGTDCNGYIIRTWTAVDDCGNTMIETQTIITQDDISPVISGIPSDITIACDEGLPAIPVPIVTDNCDNNPSLTFNEYTSGDPECAAEIRRVWTAVDDCGNESSRVWTITIEAGGGPVIQFTDPILSGVSNGATLIYDCDDIPVWDVTDAIITDGCNENSTIDFLEYNTEGDCHDDGYLYRMECCWVATDNCGNTTEFCIYIQITDLTAPVLSVLPGDITVDCNNIPGVPTITAIDNCDEDVSVIFNQNISGGGCNYSIIRSWKANDDCGNVATHTQHITVTDNSAPEVVFAPQSEVTIECGGQEPSLEPSFTDNCDDNLTLAVSSGVVQLNCGYRIEKVWTATDDCGNSTSFTQIINAIDTEAPQLVGVPQNFTVECGVDIPQVNNPPTAVDNCDDAATVSVVTQTIGSGCEYQIIYTWTAEDDCGNSTQASTTVTVIDNTDPVLSGVPGNISVPCDEIPQPATVTATDICDPYVGIEMEETTNGQGCQYSIIRTWTARDDCGNTATASQVITAFDEEAPHLTGIPGDITVECENIPQAAIPTAIDDCDEDVDIEFHEVVGGADCEYLIKRFWTATDNCGNSVMGQQTITVIDNTAPELIFTHPLLAGLEDGDVLTMECDEIELFDETDAIAEDACDPNAQVIFEEGEVVQDECEMSMLCTWIAIDGCGNSTAVTLTIHITDTTAPELLGVPEDMTVSGSEEIPVASTVSAIDNCDENVEVILSETQESAVCGYKLIRTWTATDNCGNSTNASQQIQVQGIDDVTITVTVENCEQGDGTAYLSPANYTYQWSDGGSGSNRTGMSAGIYEVTVSYANCTDVISVEIPSDCECVEPVVVNTEIQAATCGTASGSATITIAGDMNDHSFVWVPDLGTANANGNMHSDLPAGEYSVHVIFNNIGECEKKVTFTIGNVEQALEASIVGYVIADCNSANGEVSLSPTNYTYLWSDGGTGSVRSDLSAGQYEVTVTGGGPDCTDILTIEMTEDCPTTCELFTETEITAESPDQQASVCIPITVGTASQYDIILDGTSYTQPLAECVVGVGTLIEVDGFGTHELILTDNAGCSDTLLIHLLEQPEPQNPDIISTERVVAGVSCEVGEYEFCVDIPLEEISQYEITDNGVSYTAGFIGCSFIGSMSYSYNAIPGLGEAGPYMIDSWMIDGEEFSEGAFTDLEGLVSIMNAWDTEGVWAMDAEGGSIVGGQEGHIYGSLIIRQVSTGAEAMLELNRNIIPNSTRLLLDVGDHEVIFRHLETDMRDTVEVMVACTTPEHVVDTILLYQLDTMCVKTDELPGSTYTVYNICEPTGEVSALFEKVEDSNCYSIFGQALGTNDACLVICDELGICDTTYYLITVRSEELPEEPQAIVDTVWTSENVSVTFNPLANDLGSPFDSIQITTQPESGEIQVNADGTLSYIPETDYCDEDQPLLVTYTVYNAGGSDDALIYIYVKCDVIEVFTGFSPNEDGVNDYFRIEGLQKYTEHDLRIYNRWGNQVYSSQQYKSNWRGEFEGKPLPDGTYFYVLDVGEKILSGYVQIYR
ncbi:MAG: T9SS type B sorting domain-containing protein, partial [Gammaproteobacteria bacterium]|nr:T9SS type B sorting domain-containing protein [Gammaproteobacteria bacterium]